MSDWNVFVNAMMSALLTLGPLIMFMTLVILIGDWASASDTNKWLTRACIPVALLVLAVVIAWLIVFLVPDGIRERHFPISEGGPTGHNCTYYGEYIVDCDPGEGDVGEDPFYVEIGEVER